MDSLKAQFRNNLKDELQDFLKSNERIALPNSDTPVVSIVVVTWNQAELTYACLRGLEKNIAVPFELILVDNDSTDETKALLSRLDGATVVHNDDNVGFLLAVNAGSKLAKGKHILLLNNDAIIRVGSLEAAVSTLESEDTIGAVGGPIILLDGTLQEAGSIIWQDGTCLGYGRGRDKNEPEFRFRRDVDYCSGAFLLIKASTWKELGGFDEMYAPAYYEETDFCMRLRAAGQRTVYEPNAVIDHYEFGSAVKSEWALNQQIKNQQTFCRKHWKYLRNQLPPGLHNALAARSIPRSQPRVLVIDEMVPHETHGAGYPRCAEIIRTMVEEGYAVTFYPLFVPKDDWAKVYTTLPRVVEVMLDSGPEGIEAFLKARNGLYDYVFVSRPTNMQLIRGLMLKNRALFGSSKLIYDAEAIFSAREILRKKVCNDPYSEQEAFEMIERELALAEFADHIVTVSKEEFDTFRRIKPSHVSIVGHTLALQKNTPGWDERKDILFVGRLDGEGSPNVDSLSWFIQNVFPIIIKYNPSMFLTVAGKCDCPTVQSLAGPNIRLLGTVDKLEPVYNQSRVFIAPTRFAAGIPHKVHAAASYGLPCVTTKLLGKQLGWDDEVHLLAADDAGQFAKAVLKLHEDPSLWLRIRTAALEKVQIDCGKEQFKSGLDSALSPYNDLERN